MKIFNNLTTVLFLSASVFTAQAHALWACSKVERVKSIACLQNGGEPSTVINGKNYYGDLQITIHCTFPNGAVDYHTAACDPNGVDDGKN